MDVHRHHLHDRKLGDQWRMWNGENTSPERLRVGNRLFLVLLFFSILIFIILSFLFLYLIAPRLSQFSTHLPLYSLIAFSALAALALLWYGAILVIIRTKAESFCFCLGNRFFFEISSLATRFGRKIGLSRDRVGHSFIKVSNAITLARFKARSNHRVLVLLPRCLTKESRSRILAICSGFDVEVKTASGGEEARQFVYEISPDAVIGIACERDLVSGIQDVAPQIPIIGIPNIRPQGPCKATHIEYNDLEEALSLVCGNR